jgi:hypothetical protein
MFRKLVSNIAFSPALVGQLGFYAKRLKKEEMTRRLGLGFTVLALIVQSFAVFQPPTAANASSNADFVRGGVSSVSDFLKYYDRNSNHIKDIYNSLGITRAEIANAKSTTIGESSRYNWSLTSLYSYAQGQRTWSSGDSKAYYRPMRLTQEGGDSHPVYYSYSKTQGWFAIKKDCGNLITAKPPVKPPQPPKPTPTPVAACKAVGATVVNRTLVELSGSATASGGAKVSKYTFEVKNAAGAVVKTISVNSSQLAVGADSFILETPGTYRVTLTVQTSLGAKTNTTSCVKSFTIVKPDVCAYNPSLPPNSPDCQPCPGNPDIWIKDAKCDSDLVQEKTAKNTTQANADAATVVSKASDRVTYTVSVQNKGLIKATAPFVEELDDVLEYATLVDAGGGTFDEETKTLTWPSVELGAGEKQSRTFVVQLASSIPATNTGTSNEDSFNCIMTNTFGNSIDVKVDCPYEKVVVEQVVAELPTTGPKENMIFAGVVLAIVTYFYARTRQTGKEIRLIRRDVNAGTI